MGNWLKLRTISTSKFPFKENQNTLQLQYIMYWSGTPHFSHEKENVVEKLQGPRAKTRA